MCDTELSASEAEYEVDFSPQVYTPCSHQFQLHPRGGKHGVAKKEIKHSYVTHLATVFTKIVALFSHFRLDHTEDSIEHFLRPFIIIIFYSDELFKDLAQIQV